MSGNATNGEGQTPPPTNPEVAGFAGKVNNAMTSLGFVAYLFDPSQPSFDDYKGNYPDGLRDNLSGLMELANTFGMGDKLADMVDMEEISAKLTEEHVLEILIKMDDPKQFANIYNNESMKAIIGKVALPFVSDAMDKMTLAEGLKAANLNGIDLSAFKNDDGALTDIKIGDLNAETIAGYSANLDGNDDATLGFLKSLPAEQQKSIITQIATDDAGASITLKDADGKPIDMATITIEQAIEARARHEISSVNLNTQQGYLSMFNAASGFFGGPDDFGLDGAKSEVYGKIREAIPNTFMGIINAQKTNPTLPQDPAILFNELRSQIEDTKPGGGREKIAQMIKDNMEFIRTELKGAKDVAFLAQLMPDDMKSAAVAQGVRDFLHNNGFLQPIIAAVSSFLPFIGNMLRGFGLDGVADKLESFTNISRLQQDGTSRDFNNQADGTQVEPPKDTPEPTKTDPDPALTAGVVPP